MSGKNPQAIANFLSSMGKPIELQTVSTHISNIRRKIDGSARGSIIDFIEKSDRHQIVHNYYLSLLIQKEFNKSLTEIVRVVKPYVESFTILSYKQDQNISNIKTGDIEEVVAITETKQQVQVVQAQDSTKEQELINIISLIHHFQNHLKPLSENVFIEQEQHFTSISALPHSYKEKHYIIHILPLLERDSIQNDDLNKDSLEPCLNNLLLLQELQNYNEDLTDKIPFEYIDISSQQNYHFLFFEILKKLLPNLMSDLEFVCY